MTFEDKLLDYIKKNTSFKLDKSKSVEYYFGESNPLKDRLINWIENLRGMVKEISSGNPNFLPKDALPVCQQMGNQLADIIKEEFNIEGCKVGWWNDINACCYLQLANSDVYGKSKNAADIRVRLDDIVDAKNGFRYKNKKGIYYVVMLGYSIFAVDEMFTSGEAAACLVHELGHAMQHVVDSLNQNAALSEYESLYQAFTTNYYNYNPESRAYIDRMLTRLRAAFKSGNKAEIEKIGKELYEESDPNKAGFSFSQADDDRLRGLASQNDANDWEIDRIKVVKNKTETAKHGGIFHAIKNIFVGVKNIIFSPFIAIGIANMKRKLQDAELNRFKQAEETADNFAQIYGLGKETVSLQYKFTQLHNTSMNVYYGGKNSIVSRIPLMDLSFTLDSLKDDYYGALAGYPSDLGRALNIYKAAKYELANNKDLSPQAKAELEKQIESYKDFYNNFVKANSERGFFYRKIAGIQRDNIEKAAKKDRTVYDLVLKPLQKRADPNFDPDSDEGILS